MCVFSVFSILLVLLLFSIFLFFPFFVVNISSIQYFICCLLSLIFHLFLLSFFCRQDDGNPWRDEVFGILLEAWVAMAEDPQVREARDGPLRKGMEDATFPLYEQYLTYELTVRSETEETKNKILDIFYDSFPPPK